MIDQIADRAPIAAQRTFAHVRRYFNWCIEQSYLETNPCAGLKPPAVGSERERVLGDKEIIFLESHRTLEPALGSRLQASGAYRSTQERSCRHGVVRN